MSSSSDNAPLVSTKRELRNLGANTQATAAELKGRSPQEMLGIVASSQLVRSLALSSIIVFLLIITFTLIPYFMGDGSKANTASTNTKPEITQPASTPTPVEPANPEPTQPDTTPTQPDISPLGVDEEKTAPANVNPLDGGNDNFLDGLE